MPPPTIEWLEELDWTLEGGLGGGPAGGDVLGGNDPWPCRDHLLIP